MKARSPLLVPTLIYSELCHRPARFWGNPVRGAAGVCGHTLLGLYGRCHSGAGGSRRRILVISSPYFGTYFASLPRSLHSSTSPSLTGKWFAKARENILFI